MSSGPGLKFAGALTIAFIVLKLTNFINWSWWWVISPIWISFCLAFILYFILAILEDNDE